MVGRVINNLIEVRQGDSFDLIFKITNSDGENLGLEASVFKMQVRDAHGTEILNKTGSITASDALVHFYLSPEDTNVAVGDYVCDVQWTDKDGRVNTIWPQNVNTVGAFRITEQVTR